MEFKVLNQELVQLFKTDIKHVVISVRSPRTEKPVLPEQESRLDSLFLEFHDIDERCLQITDRVDCDVCGGSGYLPEYRHIEGGRCFGCNREGMNLKLFCQEDAKVILNLVKWWAPKVDLIVVNCEAGISRSSAIAGALSKIFNGDDNYFFKHYCPNSLVYRTILETHHYGYD